jgi:hypothetical protein
MLSEEIILAIVAVFAFALGFLLRGELQRFKKERQEVKQK